APICLTATLVLFGSTVEAMVFRDIHENARDTDTVDRSQGWDFRCDKRREYKVSIKFSADQEQQVIISDRGRTLTKCMTKDHKNGCDLLWTSDYGGDDGEESFVTAQHKATSGSAWTSNDRLSATPDSDESWSATFKNPPASITIKRNWK